MFRFHSAYWRRASATGLALICTAAAAADSFEQWGVLALLEGPGDASRATSVTVDDALHVITGGSIRENGIWTPVYWETPESEPTILECLGAGGNVRDVLYDTEIRGAGFCYDANDLEQPIFWETPFTLWLLPMLPGGGRVIDVAWDPVANEYAMCGTTIAGSGVQFGCYWTLDVTTGAIYWALMQPLNTYDSAALHIGLAPDGQTRIVGWSHDATNTPRAVYWDMPLTPAPVELLELSGNGAEAYTMGTVLGLKIFAGNAIDAAGNMRPVGWGSDLIAPQDMGSPGFDDATVEKLIVVDDAIYSFGHAIDATDIEHAYGWIFEGTTTTYALDLNTIVFDDAAPEMRVVNDAVARVDTTFTRVYAVGNGRDELDELQAWVGRQLDIADINRDGIVDLSDLGEVLAGFGMTSGATRDDGDLDNDGDVDLSDLGVVLANYGSHV